MTAPATPQAASTGLRHRIELVHGSVHAGPARDGGFCLEVTLPAYVRRRSWSAR
jgi:hypothetical protein